MIHSQSRQLQVKNAMTENEKEGLTHGRWFAKMTEL
jgi:hypothetical protein